MRTLQLTIAALLVAPLLAGCEDPLVDARETPAAGAQAPDAHSPGSQVPGSHEGMGEQRVEHAQAVLVSVGESGVRGEVHFEQIDGRVRVHGTIEGLTPGEHGFHVHQYGDLSDLQAGDSAGGHFAPEGGPHGRPSDEQRHAGDLGNLVANEEGVATIDMNDDVLALSGERSILGRAIVVHEKADEFVQPSGGAGGRVAFGVIGIANPEE